MIISRIYWVKIKKANLRIGFECYLVNAILYRTPFI